MKILWIFFWVITKVDYILGSFLCILCVFLMSRYRMGDTFWVAKISNIFGVLEIPDIFLEGGWGVVNSR